VKSDRILKWSKKDGFYTSFQVRGSETHIDLFKKSEWKIKHFQFKIVSAFFFTPGFEEKWGVLIERIIDHSIR
jgi:hypothetical protein